MILGFSGKALSGKDVSADHLIANHNWDVKTGFAYNLKKSCSEILNLNIGLFTTQNGKSLVFDQPVEVDHYLIESIIQWMRRTHDVSIDDVDYTSMLGIELYTPRDVLQFVGTEIMRTYSVNYHIDNIINFLDSNNKIVVSDVRFDNEVSGILDAGGYVIRIERPIEMRKLSGHVNDTDHQSEIDLDNWDGWSYKIQNDSVDLDSLYNKIDEMVSILGI